MYTQWLKYLLIVFLLVSYLNRGLFVAAPEAEPSGSAGKGEINSMVEFLQKIITGYENDIDEDGDCPEAYNCVNVQPLIEPVLVQLLSLKHPFISTTKTFFPLTETIHSSPILGLIDHPPEAVC